MSAIIDMTVTAAICLHGGRGGASLFLRVNHGVGILCSYETSRTIVRAICVSVENDRSPCKSQGWRESLMSTAELEKLLDTAEYLFYERGYQAVGMDEIRSTSGLSLKRIYALVGNKEQLAVSMLRRRDDKWHADLKAYVDKASEDRHLVAIFDWLYDWLSGAGHRGCAWINAAGEMGAISPPILNEAQRHKKRFLGFMRDAAKNSGLSEDAATTIFLLAEGCMTTVGINGDTSVVRDAQRHVEQMVQRA
ncbi:transcriptional regulator, TetR family [Corynebacterium durum F0235]|uniref:Transcriptional regulator, TetR family n=2 Tax=Corynebacterium durum TaxID=61592 RepID=L1MKN6_9CORY|nr:transcriptional regulator, TetR family [Corynebacterium durum F0235]